MNDIERSIIQCQNTAEDWLNGGRDRAKLRALKLLLEEYNDFISKNNQLPKQECKSKYDGEWSHE